MMHELRNAALKLILLSLSALASAGELQPYTATYTASQGLLRGSSVEQLTVREQGGYRLHQRMNAVVASLEEQSQFHLHEGRIRPDRYDYRFSALLKEREQRELFDWQGMKVTHSYKGETRVQTLPVGTLDRITSRLQLRRDLIDGRDRLVYTVAEKGRLRQYRFAVLGEERLQTPLGELDTIKLTRVRDADSERVTTLWLAPELDYLLVRLYQKEDDDSEFRLELESTSIKR